MKYIVLKWKGAKSSIQTPMVEMGFEPKLEYNSGIALAEPADIFKFYSEDPTKGKMQGGQDVSNDGSIP